MSFVLVGGHDRMHREYKDIGKEKGAKVKVFTQLPTRFDKCIGFPDAMLIFTKTVSHKMLRIAEKEARRKNILLIKSHSSSGSALKRAIEEINIKLKEKVM